jgi:hypothetical protein
MPSKKDTVSNRERKRGSKKSERDDTGKFSQKHIRMLERLLEAKQTDLKLWTVQTKQ